MSARSNLLKTLYARCIEGIDCNEVIYLPMIDGINITAEKIKQYERADYKIPSYDRITPIINKSIKRQNVDFFLDSRSHAARNSI